MTNADVPTALVFLCDDTDRGFAPITSMNRSGALGAR